MSDDPGMTLRQKIAAKPAAVGGVVVVGAAIAAFLVFIGRRFK